ncbi:MAG: 2-oxoisovalerate dehydrogenase [Syntrophomonadaceae bacterium]|nr:2-oxoisovalerate dehydrogenase [Syntrophomonadaceae bacterium]
MNEIGFLVEEAAEGGFTARAPRFSIFTDADLIEELKVNIREAIRCHFDGEVNLPKVVHLHFIKNEIMSL